MNGAEVGTESGAAVEPEPAEPEEDCAEDDVRDVVGLVGEALGSVAAALGEVEGDGEGSGSRGDVDTGGGLG